ncbi:MAG: DUF4870 domain-containing protein [Phycisphaerales bacterium]
MSSFSAAVATHQMAEIKSTTRRLRHEGLADQERTYALAMHLIPLIALAVFPPAMVATLIMWLARKDTSPFIDDHGREFINFAISYVLLAIFLAISIVGIPILLAWPIIGLVNVIRGIIAASNGEYFRYPMTFRFIK